MSKDIMAIDLNMYTVLYYIITLYIYTCIMCMYICIHTDTVHQRVTAAAAAVVVVSLFR